MQEKIKFEDLAVFREAQLQYKLAMQNVEIVQLKIFHAYGLKEGDNFNSETGIITRVQPQSMDALADTQKAEVSVDGKSLGEAEVEIKKVH